MNKRIGIIDIGSNSVHLVIGNIEEGIYFHMIDDVKVNVRLGEGLSETGRLQEERMAYGEETMKMFAAMLKTYQAEDVLCVATAAVRKAENGQDFVDRVKESAGITIEVIPGEEEAELDYLGVMNTIDIRDALLMDIGGGSAELVLIKDRAMQMAVSLPFGSVDLAEGFDLSDVVTPEKLEALNTFLAEAYSGCSFLKEAQGLPVIGVGGTIRNLGRIHRRQVDYPLDIAHDYRMTYDEVHGVCKMAAGMNLEERRELKGLSKGRTDIFVGSSYALLKLMETMGSETLIIADAGLRDGLAYRYLGHGKGNLIENVFETSLQKVLRHYGGNVEHAGHIHALTQKLFYELSPIHSLNGDSKKMLRGAAMLHDTGITIGYREHHEHSFYLILGSGVQGIPQKELLISAFMALNHRTNKKIKVPGEYTSLLSKEDKALIDKLSLFLQISEYLDRSMDGIVQDITCDIREDSVEMLVLSAGHSVFTDMIISECGKKFRRVYGRELVIQNKVV